MNQEIKKSNVHEIIELNMTQLGMLFHYLQNTIDNLYVVQISFILKGSLDVFNFQKALKYVQDDNEVLRSVFRWEKLSKPLQIILKECSVDFTYLDLSNEVESEIEKLDQQYLINDRKKRFDLTELPLRIRINKISNDEYRLIITHHHILYDGWSTGIFMKELLTRYRELTYNLDLTAVFKPQIKDLVASLKHETITSKEKIYWKQYLMDVEIADVPSSINDHSETKKIIRQTTIYKIKDFVKKHKVTPASFVYTAYGLLLHKLNDTSDVIFGTAVANRNAQVNGINSLMGNFINTLPLRLCDFEDSSFLQLVKSVNQELIKRNEYCNTSYPEIKKVLEIGSKEDLFNSVVAVENYPIDESILNSIDNLKISLDKTFENIDMPLMVSVYFDKNLVVEFNFKSEFYSCSLIEILADQFITIVNSIVSSPDKLIKTYCSVSEREQNELFTKFNHTDIDYPREKTIVNLIEEQVQKTPSRIALVCNCQQLKYEELNERSNQFARKLIDLGLKEGDFVGIILTRRMELMIALLGVLKTGCTYVPIDPDYPKERIDYIIENSGISFILTETELEPGLVKDYPNIDFFNVLDDTLSNYGKDNLKIKYSSSVLAYIIYTSGSTGTPKGIMTEHRNVVSYIYGILDSLDLEKKESILCISAVSFDPFVTETFLPLMKGMKVVLADSEAKKDTIVLSKLIIDNKVNIVQFTPSLLRILLKTAKVGFLNSVKILTIGAEPFDDKLIQTLKKQYKGKIYDVYGPTETTVWCSMRDLTDRTIIDVGHPISNYRIYILDKNENLQPIGFKGEICIGGDGLSRGYIKNESLTNKQFVEIPNLPEEKVYKTGDLAIRQNDGSIFLLGRKDNQVKIRGFRIELKEIECQLIKHESINELVVAVKEDEGNKYLAAYFVSESNPKDDDLRDFLINKLPDYMIPSYFFQMDSMPLNPNGKVNRKVLPDPKKIFQKENIEPHSKKEVLLANVWSEILGHDRIGVTDDYYSLGGDSIKSILISSKIRSLGYSIAIKDIFTCRNIRVLASKLVKAENEQNINKIAKIKKLDHGLTAEQLDDLNGRYNFQDIYLLSPMQKGMLYHFLLNPGEGQYLEQFTCEVHGELNIEVVEQVMNRIIERYHVLRTLFIYEGLENPVQLVLKHRDIDFEFKDIREELTTGLKEKIVDSYQIQERSKNFDLSKDVLIRLKVLQTGSKEFVFIWSNHHIVMDGWCMGIIVKEFRELYLKVSRAEEIKFSKVTPYSNYINWIYNIQGAESKNYWKEYLKSFETVTTLPKKDASKSDDSSYKKCSLKIILDKNEQKKLNNISAKYGVTSNTIFQTAWSILLSKYNNTDDVVFGSVVSGRPSDIEGVESMVGLFINTIPVRIKLETKMNFG